VGDGWHGSLVGDGRHGREGGGRDPVGQHEVHVLARTLDHLDHAFLARVDDLSPLTVDGRQLGSLFRTHLNEGFSRWLALLQNYNVQYL